MLEDGCPLPHFNISDARPQEWFRKSRRPSFAYLFSGYVCVSASVRFRREIAGRWIRTERLEWAQEGTLGFRPVQGIHGPCPFLPLGRA